VQAPGENQAINHNHLQRMLFQERQSPEEHFPGTVRNVNAGIQKYENLRTDDRTLKAESTAARAESAYALRNHFMSKK
jgi:hypothetical protein